MEYHILASGSKGNSVFIWEQGVGILIDCGISKRQLIKRLTSVSHDLDEINYVLLTHDHSDHNKYISIFNEDIVYCGKGCIPDMMDSQELVPYQDKQLAHYTITPLAISHDATSPLAFSIRGEQEKILYMTDTGYVSKKNEKYMTNHEYYIMESNHDVEMLMDTARPYFIKQRIASDIGHMNNEYSASVMARVIGKQTKEITLAHLSGEANSPDKALTAYQQIFDSHQISFSNIRVASQQEVVSGGVRRED